jgi:hypothetical protein
MQREDPLIKNVHSLHAVVVRMHTHNLRSHAFFNRTRDFVITLVNEHDDADEPRQVSFSVNVGGTGNESHDAALHRVMELDGECVSGDDGYWIEMFDYDMDALEKDPALLLPAMRMLNVWFDVRVCACREHFVKDWAEICLQCQLVEGRDQPRHRCAICHESSIERHLVRQPCCKQMLHGSCLSRWLSFRREQGQDGTCPYCRAGTG